MTQFLPYFGSFGWTVGAFVVALSIIVAVHEYGHYIVGRWCGIHAEVYSIGFGPRLWSRYDKRGTRWQIALVPLGGYVRFKGDANAASIGGTSGGRNTMLGAPLWARSATVLAGPFANFLFSVVVYTGLFMFFGAVTNPLTLRSVPELPPTYVQELQAGDEILAVGGIEVGRVEELDTTLSALPLERVLNYTVMREGQTLDLRGPYPSTTLVQSVVFNGAAAAAGIVPGDVVVAINGQEVWHFNQMVEIVTGSNGEELSVDIWRDGEMVQFALSPTRSDEPQSDGSFKTYWRMGIQGGSFFDAETGFPGVFSAIDGAIYRVWFILKTSISGLAHMISGDISSCNLSSPIGIAQAAGAMASAGLADFIGLLAVISAAVGMLNLFPIPILDGGHLVFHAYEAVTRRKPSDSAVQYLMLFGLALIGSVMVLAFANDLFLC